MGAKVIYSPYNQNLGWSNHPNTITPKQMYPQPSCGTSMTNQYGEPMPYTGPKETEIKTEQELRPTTEDIVYTEQPPLKNSSRQDYELYLMEKEYYFNESKPQKYQPNTGENRHMKKITCENLPLATAYVRPQPYQNLNSPVETLSQGTLFADLYSPYAPRKVAMGGRR